MTTNGQPKQTITREEVVAARRQANLLRYQIECHRLEQVQKMTGRGLLESIGDYWVNVVGDRLAADQGDRDDLYWMGLNFHGRRTGRNYPIYQNEQELRLLVMQSRILCSIEGYAIGLLEGLTSYVLGDGFVYRAASKHTEKPQPELADAVQDLIDQFLESVNWYGGAEPGLEEELFKRSVRDGEYFLIHWPAEDGRLEVRTAEPEQITQPFTGAHDVEEYLFGIRTPKNDVQKHLAYWVQWGESVSDGEEYDASRVVHFRRNVDRSIRRGFPDFSFTTFDILRICGMMRKNMGEGAAIQASYAGIRQHEVSTQADVRGMNELVSAYTLTDARTPSNKEYLRKFTPGMVDIPKGMTFVAPPNAQNAAAHVQILQACLRGAGQRWNAPEWLSSADASTTNYSSSLTAESQFVKRVGREQRRYKSAFLKTVWTAVEHAITFRGGLTVRVADGDSLTEKHYSLKDIKRLIEIQVEAPNPEAESKIEEAQRDQIYASLKVKSVQTIQQQLGLDPEEEQVNMDEWNELNAAQAGGLPDMGFGGPEQGGELPPEIEESLQESRQDNGIELAESFWDELGARVRQLREAAGTCKPGERADLTGCTPATDEPAGGGKSMDTDTEIPAAEIKISKKNGKPFVLLSGSNKNAPGYIGSVNLDSAKGKKVKIGAKVYTISEVGDEFKSSATGKMSRSVYFEPDVSAPSSRKPADAKPVDAPAPKPADADHPQLRHAKQQLADAQRSLKSWQDAVGRVPGAEMNVSDLERAVKNWQKVIDNYIAQKSSHVPAGENPYDNAWSDR